MRLAGIARRRLAGCRRIPLVTANVLPLFVKWSGWVKPMNDQFKPIVNWSVGIRAPTNLRTTILSKTGRAKRMNAGSPINPDGSSGKDAGDKSRTTLIERSIPLTDNHINSRDLFLSSREIMIVHGEDTYRLRLTAQNKLILTK
jgi:hemin uptake protein HemP